MNDSNEKSPSRFESVGFERGVPTDPKVLFTEFPPEGWINDGWFTVAVGDLTADIDRSTVEVTIGAKAHKKRRGQTAAYHRKVQKKWNKLVEKRKKRQSKYGWRPIETAPRDGTKVLGWCNHKADPYWLNDGFSLTDYGLHSESVAHARDGIHVVEWGGEYHDVDCVMPNWWFVSGTDFEVAANPTHWKPLPLGGPLGEKL